DSAFDRFQQQESCFCFQHCFITSAVILSRMSSGALFCWIAIYGDNDELLAFIEVKSNTLPTTYTLSVDGVQQLRMVATSDNGRDGGVYILNATIE
ncbi:MAG: hypothetical protein J6C42_12370, partial [Clostridia bacterium]|nr:hypothetical protein [Clostridia bacterium]